MNEDKYGFHDYGDLCIEEARLSAEWVDCMEESYMTKKLSAQAREKYIRANIAYDRHAELMEEVEAKLFDEVFKAHANQKGKHIATFSGKRKHSRDRRGTRKAQEWNHETKVFSRLRRAIVRKNTTEREFRRDLSSPSYIYDQDDEWCDGVQRDNSLEHQYYLDWLANAQREQLINDEIVCWDGWDGYDYDWMEQDLDEFDRCDDPAMTIYLPEPVQGPSINDCIADRLSERFGNQSVEAFMRFYQEAAPSGMNLYEFIYHLGDVCNMDQDD